MNEPLFIQVTDVAADHINEMTHYNTAPEQSPILRIPGIGWPVHVKHIGFNYGNYDRFEVMWFNPNDLDAYLSDDETFGEKYESITSYAIHSKDAFDVVSQVLILAGWTGVQLTRLWGLIQKDDVKWTWNNVLKPTKGEK